MRDLVIRHRMWMDGGVFVVEETFGDATPSRFICYTREQADALIAERQKYLKEMVASISAEARKAVEEARTVDNLKAGNA